MERTFLTGDSLLNMDVRNTIYFCENNVKHVTKSSENSLTFEYSGLKTDWPMKLHEIKLVH